MVIQWIVKAILLFPLIGALFIGLLNHRLSKRVTTIFAITSVSISGFLSIYCLNGLIHLNILPINFVWFQWGILPEAPFYIGFLIDRLSATMMVVVTLISLLVHIYSIGYMANDSGYRRFFAYLQLFTFGMLSLVMSNNFLQLFFGWEMVGLVSYLLIGFWFDKNSAISANMKAFIVNRVGDLGFILGISAILFYFGSLDYMVVFKRIEEVLSFHEKIVFITGASVNQINFICFTLFLGAMGKSAQVPLHVWLPDSMEGPTPISALIHAATMVTAGVFMLARLSPLFEYAPAVLQFVLLVGALTCLISGLLSLSQIDIKRVIAYSTISQLGYMMMAMGGSCYALGIFHLVTHAFFKALLFLGAGCVIVALHHNQDIRQMGGLRKNLPVTYWTMLIGSLALIGFPGTAGFYSKDLIIESMQHLEGWVGRFSYWVALGGVLITTVYTFRLFFIVFHYNKSTAIESPKLHAVGVSMKLPLMILSIGSLIVGWFLLTPILSGFFDEAIPVLPQHQLSAKIQIESASAMFLQAFTHKPFLLNVIGLVGCWIYYTRFHHWSKAFSVSSLRFFQHYGLDNFYKKGVATGAYYTGYGFWKFIDLGVIDNLVNGMSVCLDAGSDFFKRIQKGDLNHYILLMIGGLLLLIFWLLYYVYTG